MVWFKTDDAFGRHRKVRKLGKTDKLAAVGLWLLAGTWSAADTADGGVGDGFLPREQVLEWDPKLRYAKRLVDVGFWEEAEREGEPGYQFHDWADYQPTKASIEAERETWRTKKAAQRKGMSKGDSPGDSPGTGGHETVSNGSQRPSPEDNRTNVLDPHASYPQEPQGAMDQSKSTSDSRDAQMSPRDTQGESGESPPEFPDPVPVPVPSSGDLPAGGYVPARASAPPNRCPKHATAPAGGPCRACADARQTRQAWDAAEAEEAEAARLAAARCRLCDGDGNRWDPAGKHRGTVGPCDHKPLPHQESA